MNLALVISALSALAAWCCFPFIMRMGCKDIRQWIDPVQIAKLNTHRSTWRPAAAVLAILLSLGVLPLGHTTDLMPLIWALFLGIWAALLVASSQIDISTRLLPDRLTGLMVLSGLLFHASTAPAFFLDALIGAAAGYLGLLLVGKAFKTFRGLDAIGRGDFAMLAGIGAWVGWQHLPLAILLACLVGLTGAAITALRGRLAGHNESIAYARLAISFGPALAIGGAAAWLNAGPSPFY